MVIQPIVTSTEAGNAFSSQQGYATNANNTLTSAQNSAISQQQPYINLGNQAASSLSNNLTALTTPVNMNQATLEQTPGYQFTLNQGLEAVNNQSAAQGLGVSGAQQKAAANYATGLASNTYQQQFNNAVTNQNNIFSRLMSTTGLGQQSATNASNAYLGTGSQIAGNQVGLGNASAAYYNSIGGSINNSLSNAAGIGGAAYLLG